MSKNSKFDRWNPKQPPDISPKEYEQQVVAWLRKRGDKLLNFSVNHLQHMQGTGGDYEFDAIAKFELFDGAEFIVLIECKRYSRPVDRDKVMSLWAKLQDVKAQKAMIFATCGFQSGAIKYATEQKIASVIFTSEDFRYMTKSADPVVPDSRPNSRHFIGILTRANEDKIACSSFDSTRIEPLMEWLWGK